MRAELILLTVVRHGESDANKRGIVSDKNIDHQLTEKGVQQAKDAAEFLKDEHFDLVVTSSRTRARKTAEIINEHHHVSILEYTELIERDFGIFSGISKADADRQMSAEGFSWAHIPQSEDYNAIDKRVKSALDDVILHNPLSRNILIATHEDIVRSLHRILNHASAEESTKIIIKNSAPHRFELEKPKGS